MNYLLKILLLRLRYKFFSNSGDSFWAQKLIDGQGLSAKIGQVFAQGKSYQLPKPTIHSKELKKLFFRQFGVQIIINEEASAASMGQVFMAELNKEKLAIKILHKDIRRKIKKEIENIIFLGSYYSKSRGFTFKKELFSKFLTDIFEEETDLNREAIYQENFRLRLGENRFKIPAVIKNLSNESVLTQKRIDCLLAKDVDNFPNYLIFDFFFESLMEHGLLHGDLNDRNWGLLNDQEIVIYDFGCSQIISQRRINGLKKLLANIDIINGFKEIGLRLEATPFKNREQELRDELFYIFERESVEPGYSYSGLLQEKFGDEIKRLREFTDPWVLLLMRSFFSLIKIYHSKNQAIPLSRIISPYLKIKEDSTKLKEIKIEVTENFSVVVFLTLPLSELSNLESLLPEKVSLRIKEENIKLNSIIQKVIETNYEAQDLFKLEMGNRKYRVWLD